MPVVARRHGADAPTPFGSERLALVAHTCCAKRFKVSPDCVRRLLKRYQTEGTIEPKLYQGGNQPLLQSEHLEVLTTLVEEDNDATLPQLAQRLEAKTKLKVSSSTISRGIKKINLTRKKNF